MLQLCFYSQELGRIQGRAPSGCTSCSARERESFRLADFDAYYRRIRGRLVEFVAEEPETYPWPVEHCSICAFAARCNAQWDADDHLTRVAWIGRGRSRGSRRRGSRRSRRSATRPADTEVEQMAPRTFETLRHQAALQLGHRRTGEHRYDLLEPVPERGLGLLPRARPTATSSSTSRATRSSPPRAGSST